MRGTAIDKVLHIITDLGQGGAETVLYRLVTATADGFEHQVVSLHDEGVYAQPLRERGVSVTALGMPRGSLTIAALRRLQRLIAAYQPDVIQSRLDHANLVRLLVGADLTGADIRRTDLRGADMRRSDFEECVFDGALMDGAILTRKQAGQMALSDAQKAAVDWRQEDGPEPSGG